MHLRDLTLVGSSQSRRILKAAQRCFDWVQPPEDLCRKHFLFWSYCLSVMQYCHAHNMHTHAFWYTTMVSYGLTTACPALPT